jgi:hypothetical protein
MPVPCVQSEGMGFPLVSVANLIIKDRAQLHRPGEARSLSPFSQSRCPRAELHTFARQEFVRQLRVSQRNQASKLLLIWQHPSKR